MSLWKSIYCRFQSNYDQLQSVESNDRRLPHRWTIFLRIWSIHSWNLQIICVKKNSFNIWNRILKRLTKITQVTIVKPEVSLNSDSWHPTLLHVLIGILIIIWAYACKSTFKNFNSIHFIVWEFYAMIDITFISNYQCTAMETNLKELSFSLT